MAERVLDDAADPTGTDPQWWSTGSPTRLPPRSDRPVADPDDGDEAGDESEGASDRSGHSPRRRRFLLSVAVLSAITIVVAGASAVVVLINRPPPLVLELVDATDENPLPDELLVRVNGDLATPEIRDGTAFVTVDDAFDDRDVASVSLFVPEEIDLEIAQALADDEGIDVRISDDDVIVGDVQSERANPVRVAHELAEKRERQRIAAQEAEQARVDGELVSIDAQMTAARGRFDAIWTGRDTAPYAEIAAVVNGEILPVVDAVLGRLGALASSDQLSQEAVTAWAACVTATRAAYVRESFSDSTLTYEQNEAQQTDLWSASGAACSDAAAKQVMIG